MLVVGIEHLLLAIKVIIGYIISDVPAEVIESEFKREFIKKQAKEKILRLQK